MSQQAPVRIQDEGRARCPNCAAAAGARFCPECGQSQRSLRISIWDLAREHLHDAFGLEGRLFRTLRVLVTRPGAVTRDFHQGRRVSYTPPVRLYLVVSAVYFASYLLTRTIDRAFFGFSGAGDTGFASAMARGLLLSVPVLALAMKLIYARSGWHLVEHAIFLFHVGAAGLLGAWLSLLVATGWKLIWTEASAAPFNPGWFHLAAFAAFGVYLALALQRTYGETLTRSALRAAMLLVLLVVLAATFPTMIRWIA